MEALKGIGIVFRDCEKTVEGGHVPQVFFFAERGLTTCLENISRISGHVFLIDWYNVYTYMQSRGASITECTVSICISYNLYRWIYIHTGMCSILAYYWTVCFSTLQADFLCVNVHFSVVDAFYLCKVQPPRSTKNEALFYHFSYLS